MVALLLHWLYAPQLATPAELEAARGRLDPVLRLAHKLGAQGLLAKLSRWWCGESAGLRR